MSGPGDGADVFELARARRGHFVLESGHHGALWLELERLCLRPARIRPLAAALADRLRSYGVDVVCGPLVEGAFVALVVAELLDVPFTYAARLPARGGDLFPHGYAVPRALASTLVGKSVAVVNDVVNAGSAVGGTLADLRRLGARPVVIGALATLGDGAAALAAAHHLGLECLVARTSELWDPRECPLCVQGVALECPEARDVDVDS